jgi:hypothetical protein
MNKTGVLNVRDVPKEIVHRFKATCAMEGMSMRDAIISLMQAVGDGNLSLKDLPPAKGREG